MSGLQGSGLDKFWDTVLEHRRVLTDAGEFDEKRRRQQIDWTWTMVHDQLLRRLADNPDVKSVRARVEEQVRVGTLTAALAAERLLNAFDGSLPVAPTRTGRDERVLRRVHEIIVGQRAR